MQMGQTKFRRALEPPTVKLIREVRRARSRAGIGVDSRKLELGRDRAEVWMRYV